MIIEKYSDLKKVKNNVIIDLSKLNSNLYIRALDFLAGLTFRNGRIIKLEKQKFLIKLNRNNNLK